MKKFLSFLCFGFLLLTVSLNAQGWEKVFLADTALIGTSGFSAGFEVVQTQDEGFLLAGEVDYPTGAVRHYLRLVKTDEFGNLQWKKTYKAGAITQEQVYFLEELDDGKIILIGDQFGHPYLMQTDAQGEMLWEKTILSDTIHHTKDALRTDDGGYLITGYLIQDFGIPSEIFLIKTDDVGVLLWKKVFTFTDFASAEAIAKTEDGGFILVGNLDNNITLFKLNATGDLEWQKSYNFSDAAIGFAIQQTADKGFIVGGSRQAIGSNISLIFKTDSLGNGEWSKGLTGNTEDKITNLVILPDGNYAIVGNLKGFFTASVNGFLVKIDTLGEVQNSLDFNFSNKPIASVRNTNDGGLILAGFAEGGMLLKKIDGTTATHNITSTKSEIDVFPNPMTSETFFEIKNHNSKTIHLQVFDSTGKLMRRETHDDASFIFYRKNLAGGIYFYQIKNEQKVLGNGKLIITDNN